LLLWARRAGDIDRQRRPPSSNGATQQQGGGRPAASAGSAMLLQSLNQRELASQSVIRRPRALASAAAALASAN